MKEKILHKKHHDQDALANPDFQQYATLGIFSTRLLRWFRKEGRSVCAYVNRLEALSMSATASMDFRLKFSLCNTPLVGVMAKKGFYQEVTTIVSRNTMLLLNCTSTQSI